VRLTIFACAIMALWAIHPARAETLAEKLGFGPQDRVLILHADDIGMCHASNAAYTSMISAGLVKTGSVMVPCPWFPEIAAYAREHPDHDLGLHLTLTAEWSHYRWGPVAGKAKVPGLVDPEGFLWKSVADVVRHATAEEVETEIRAQVERALAFGLKPTHLDSHMGTLFATPQFFQAYLKVGREFDIPVMVPNWSPELQKYMDSEGISIPRELFRQLEAQGFVLLDYLMTSGAEGRTPAERRQSYYETFRKLKPGVTQIILHPAIDGPELSHITGSHDVRDADFRVLSDPETLKFLKSQGIHIIGWRDLRKAWKTGVVRQPQPPAG